jgi:hypothetical protein
MNSDSSKIPVEYQAEVSALHDQMTKSTAELVDMENTISSISRSLAYWRVKRDCCLSHQVALQYSLAEWDKLSKSKIPVQSSADSAIRVAADDEELTP